MALAEEAVYARLTAHAGTAALVGARVYPLKLPQTPTLPAVTYQRISATRESAMGSDTGITRARFQVTSHAASYSGVKALAEQVRQALQRYSGTSATVTVHDCFLENEIDLFDQDDALAGHYPVAQDFIVIYGE